VALPLQKVKKICQGFTDQFCFIYSNTKIVQSMKQTLLTITALLLNLFIFGQEQDIWVRYYDSTTELSGYKDLQGNIKLPARFNGFTRADTFYHIIAVNETIDGSYKQYYLLKNGKKIGQDSVYVNDFTFDCESEGKIMFKDWKKDRVGFLDANGIAIIPAVYNYVSPFRNGIAIAHKNAQKKCWEKGGDTTNCEHLGWEGGETILINEKNEILADSLGVDLSNINWYSKNVNAPPQDTNIYVSIKGKNGLTYWFIDYNKEFKKWFYDRFLQTLHNNGNIHNMLFDEVTFSSKTQGWTSLEKNNFLKTFPDVLTTKRFEQGKLKQVSIDQYSLNELIYEKDIYKKYLNSCGEHKRDKFPLFDVMLNYYKKRQNPIPGIQSEFLKNYEIDYQEHFEFLRTENGYRLLSVVVKR
jgi:hypothetical protein